jgi:hypothetical protein
MNWEQWYFDSESNKEKKEEPYLSKHFEICLIPPLKRRVEPKEALLYNNPQSIKSEKASVLNKKL